MTNPILEPKRPMLAQICICQGCCCGKTEKGHPPVPVDWLKQEWKYRGLLKRIHLTITGCLGPCELPNVVAILSSEGSQWLASLTTQGHYAMLADWAERCKMAGTLLPLPKALRAQALDPWRKEPALHFDGRQ